MDNGQNLCLEKVLFEILADSIKNINTKAGNAAKSAVNQLMTLRNWAIGYYIVEYEQGGMDHLQEFMLKEMKEMGI